MILIFISHVAAFPQYHYVGIMYPPNPMWTMYEPYAEYEVGTQLCRAATEPKCTWWNAMAISTANSTLHNHTLDYYSDIPFFPTGLTQILFDVTETQCLFACHNSTTCIAALWERTLDTCFIAEERIHTGLPINASITVPTTRYYIKKTNFSSILAQHEIQRMLIECDCIMDTFRCPHFQS